MAAYILGHTGDIGRFPTAGHYARYNATAPISASTAANDRHRLNPYGNRQLNHALHVAAVTQAGHDTLGRVYYQRKLDEGNSRKEALQRSNDRSPTPSTANSSPTPHTPDRVGPGGQTGTTLQSSVAG